MGGGHFTALEYIDWCGYNVINIISNNNIATFLLCDRTRARDWWRRFYDVEDRHDRWVTSSYIWMEGESSVSCIMDDNEGETVNNDADGACIPRSLTPLTVSYRGMKMTCFPSIIFTATVTNIYRLSNNNQLIPRDRSTVRIVVARSAFIPIHHGAWCS